MGIFFISTFNFMQFSFKGNPVYFLSSFDKMMAKKKELNYEHPIGWVRIFVKG